VEFVSLINRVSVASKALAIMYFFIVVDDDSFLMASTVGHRCTSAILLICVLFEEQMLGGTLILSNYQLRLPVRIALVVHPTIAASAEFVAPRFVAHAHPAHPGSGISSIGIAGALCNYLHIAKFFEAFLAKLDSKT
jgi:hypothetical protein